VWGLLMFSVLRRVAFWLFIREHETA